MKTSTPLPIERGGSVKEVLHDCLSRLSCNSKKCRADAVQACFLEVTDGLIAAEQIAQRQYGEASEALSPFKETVLEIQRDEIDHEKKLRVVRTEIAHPKKPIWVWAQEKQWTVK
jgi:hypothetical protein